MSVELNLKAPLLSNAVAVAVPENCGICLQAIVGNQGIGHGPDNIHPFHERCIAPWRASNGTCPICRAALSPVQVQIEVQEEEQPSSHRAYSHKAFACVVAGCFTFITVLAAVSSALSKQQDQLIP